MDMEGLLMAIMYTLNEDDPNSISSLCNKFSSSNPE